MPQITRSDVQKVVRESSQFKERVIDDVLRIVNGGFRYRSRGGTEEFRIPEDISTGIALKYFGVNAYGPAPAPE